MNRFTSRLQRLLCRIFLSLKWDHKIQQFFDCKPSAANLTTVIFNSYIFFSTLGCFPSSLFPSFTVSCVKGGALCLFWRRSKWNTTGRREAAHLAQTSSSASTSSFSFFSTIFYTFLHLFILLLLYVCCRFMGLLEDCKIHWDYQSYQSTNYCRCPVNLFRSLVFSYRYVCLLIYIGRAQNLDKVCVVERIIVVMMVFKDYLWWKFVL